MRAQTKRIILYIVIAAVIVIFGAVAILFAPKSAPASAQEHIDLGHTYLIELSYDKAVIEFTEAIEIEPLNADAYLGLAEAYVGIGDNEKAVEVLEKGYDKTADERLKDMLEEAILPPEETTIATTATNIEVMKIEETNTNKFKSEDFIIIKCKNEYHSSIHIDKYSTELTYLNFNGCNLTDDDIAPLEKMINLKELYLLGNNITNISFLNNITKLERLNFNSNKISDINTLLNLKQLSYLDLSYNEISDISVLSNLEQLRVLDLKGNKINDISKLSDLINLRHLELDGNNITDINSLKSLADLQVLYISDNQISNIDSLFELKDLKQLRIYGNPISESDIEKLKRQLPECVIMV